MRYTLTIDQVKSLEWGLNINQSHLFGLLTKVQLWADEVVFEGRVYYFASRQMIIKEIPLCYLKPDTVYKALCKLRDLELIEYQKFGVMDIIRLTDKGKEWNSTFSSDTSDINPNELRNESENNSDINLTYHSTTIEKSTTKKYIYNSFYDSEIEKANKSGNNQYPMFVKWLFLQNPNVKPLTRVLNMANQISFTIFNELILKYTPKEITDTTLAIQNYTKRTYSSYNLTLRNWLSRLDSQAKRQVTNNGQNDYSWSKQDKV